MHYKAIDDIWVEIESNCAKHHKLIATRTFPYDKLVYHVGYRFDMVRYFAQVTIDEHAVIISGLYTSFTHVYDLCDPRVFDKVDKVLIDTIVTFAKHYKE